MAAKTIAFVNKNDAGSTVRTYNLPYSKFDATTAPGVSDDDTAGYVAGSVWADRTNHKVYECTNNATGAAVWLLLGSLADGTYGDIVVSSSGATWTIGSTMVQDIISLTDPGADKLAFWDDSAGHIAWLTLGTNLSITGTTIDAAGGGGGSGTVTNASNLTDNAIVRGDGGTVGVQTSGVIIDDTNNVTGVASIDIAYAGLKLQDTGGQHMVIHPVCNTGTFAGDRVLQIGMPDANTTLTLGGDLTTSGSFTTTLTVTGNTNVTLPTSGTLITQAQADAAYQPLDATLTALAAANWAANALPIGTGADTLSQTTFAANTFPARASTGNLVAKTITDFILTLTDDADAATARTTLGLGTLATQSGTFSGTSSGTNTGDQTITLTSDVTGSGMGSFATTIANNAVTYAKMQDVSATSRIIGRKTASAGDPEECTLSDVLDFVGSAAQGDILYRGASTWTRLAAGTSGYVLTTGGAGANPSWASASSLASVTAYPLLQNLSIYSYASSGTLHVELRTNANATPSGSDYPTIPFRNSTLTTGTYTNRTPTSSTTMSLSSGSYLGVSDNVPFKLWVVAIDDGGTVRLGLMNCYDGASKIYPLRDDEIVTSTTEGGGNNTATSSGVLYSETASTVTITNASPAVITWTSHGLVAGQAIMFSTTGTLPTGIASATTYYVISAGLSTNSFEISATVGGSAINTSSAGSGTHTGHAGCYQRPIRILGYLEWYSGLSSHTSWGSAPDKVQLYGPGVALPGHTVQQAGYTDSSVATGSTAIPFDNTKPQNTEGVQYFSQAITVQSAANVLEVDAKAIGCASGASFVAMALFRDSGADAVRTTMCTVNSANWANQMALVHRVIAGSTGSTTWKVRIGIENNVYTWTLNGQAGSGYFNGTFDSHLFVREIMT